MAEDLVFAPVRQLAEAVRARRVSPVALAETFLERLERSAPATTPWSRSRASARWSRRGAPRREIAAGRDRGPLHGIPYGAKDLLATPAASPPRGARRRFEDQGFDYDATVIRKLEAAGAVLVRQAGHGRAGRRHGLPPAERLVHRARHQAVESRRVERRLVERLGLGGGGRARALRDRLGDLGLDPHARGLLRRRRAAADLRPRQPPRRDGAVLDARQARARSPSPRTTAASCSMPSPGPTPPIPRRRRGRIATRRRAGRPALPLRRAART